MYVDNNETLNVFSEDGMSMEQFRNIKEKFEIQKTPKRK